MCCPPVLGTLFTAVSFGFLLALSPVIKAAQPVKACVSPATVVSGPGATGIVELFTSEGCDSCPPADKWFSALPAIDGKLIPLAFHVDYWDYIGWKDRFGKPSFAERQRAEVSRGGGRTVYTPQVLYNGKDWRGLSGSTGLTASVGDMNARPSRAAVVLGLKLAESAKGGVTDQPAAMQTQSLEVHLSVKIADANERKDAALFMAITENNLTSRVGAGENRGATLTHDHLVRELIGPIAIPVEGTLEVSRLLALLSDWKLNDMHIAAFVQNQRNGDVLQAVSSPLCR